MIGWTDGQVLMGIADGQPSLLLLLVGDGLSLPELLPVFAIHEHFITIFGDHQEFVVLGELGAGDRATEADDLLEDGPRVDDLVDADLFDVVVSHQQPQVFRD